VVPIVGIALLVVAPVLVACTGLVFIPLMFSVMGRRIAQERAVFQQLP